MESSESKVAEFKARLPCLTCADWPLSQATLRSVTCSREVRDHTRSNVSSPNFSRLHASLSPGFSQTRFATGIH